MGRPREFGYGTSRVARAMQRFGGKAMEGTSLTVSTEELGINRPSLYAAFGSREALFLKARRPLTRSTQDTGKPRCGTDARALMRERCWTVLPICMATRTTRRGAWACKAPWLAHRSPTRFVRSSPDVAKSGKPPFEID